MAEPTRDELLERLEVVEKQLEVVQKSSVKRKDILSILRQRPHDPIETILPKSIGSELLKDASVGADQLIQQPYCTLSRSANQTGIAHNTDNLIEWDLTREDPDGMHDINDPTRITFKKDGLYLIVSSLSITTNNASGIRWYSWCYLNDPADQVFLNSHSHEIYAHSGDDITTSFVWRFSAGDYIQNVVWQFQLSGTSSETLIKSASNTPEFQAIWLRP